MSVRLPSRTVPICVSEPMGLETPRRMASTPAMKVVATAPMPGIMMPSLPLAGLISTVGPDLVSGMRVILLCCDLLSSKRQAEPRPQENRIICPTGVGNVVRSCRFQHHTLTEWAARADPDGNVRAVFGLR